MKGAATLLCWNVAGRVKRLPEQAARVVALNADLICLQEVTARTAPLWRWLLQESGWPHVEVAPLTEARAQGRSRPLGVLTAARRPFARRRVEDLPWPERVLSVRHAGLELFNVHSPISPSPGLAKVRTHEVLHARLQRCGGPVALCGDLNTPRREHADGSVWTFARTRNGKLRPERGERWDLAEQALIRALEPDGFRDAFRALHGHDVRELSWEWPRSGGGYRLDHLIVSEKVSAEAVSYLHAWRKDGLSDHSPLLARLRWPATPVARRPAAETPAV